MEVALAKERQGERGFCPAQSEAYLIKIYNKSSKQLMVTSLMVSKVGYLLLQLNMQCITTYTCSQLIHCI